MTETPPGTDPAPLSDRQRDFLAEPHFATLATLDPDGSPRQAVIWYTLEGAELIINSAMGRRWPANLVRDPRAAIAIVDRHDGLRWVGVNGVVQVVRDQPTAQADIAAMARRYHADEPDEAEQLISGRFQTQERISFRVAIGAVFDHLD
ncbi:MAG: TIGR03618 family F420-dependent PPOX class oxidoreductase [Candidatus Limnocylindrales bacterium]